MVKFLHDYGLLHIFFVIYRADESPSPVSIASYLMTADDLVPSGKWLLSEGNHKEFTL